MNISSNKPITNRSIPACTVIPVLTYEDVGQAVDWLCNIFGFTERLRIGNHRAQLMIGDFAPSRPYICFYHIIPIFSVNIHSEARIAIQ